MPIPPTGQEYPDLTQASESKIDAHQTKIPESNQTMGICKSIFLIARSIIGVGVLTQPHLNEEFGVFPILICYPLVAATVIYCLSLLPTVADHMNYAGSSLEEFTEQALGKVHRRLVTVFNLIFCISVSIVATIFSVSFVNYALCQLGDPHCNNSAFLHIAGALLCLPLAFIHNVIFFELTKIGFNVCVLCWDVSDHNFNIAGNYVDVPVQCYRQARALGRLHLGQLGEIPRILWDCVLQP